MDWLNKNFRYLLQAPDSDGGSTGGSSPTSSESTAEQIKAANSQKMEENRKERVEKDKTAEDQLIVIHGAKIKFNAHLGEFKVLNDVPTTQDKLTGTTVEKQIPNFTFYDGFQMLSLTEWMDFGSVKVQENEALIKKSILPATGKMPGNIPPETGKIEFVDSGQVNIPESIYTEGAPVPEKKTETCGIEYREKIECTRYGKQYGPVYWGALKLANYTQWNILLEGKKMTDEEKEIIIGMSENEGKLDSVQSYDSEIVTVGAMQKTVNPQGYGEFPIQMYEFKEDYPEKFKALFENCGWTVKKTGEKYRVYYLDVTGSELKNKIREGFSVQTYKKKTQCIPIEPLINASKDPYFQAKQIEDFIKRLHSALNETVVKSYHLNKKKVKVADENYTFKAKDVLKSKLGKATLLDQSVNRPALTKFDLGSALNRFFQKNPKISTNPSEWAEKHEEYEKIILDDYGINRNGTDMSGRYSTMKNNPHLN